MLLEKDLKSHGSIWLVNSKKPPNSKQYNLEEVLSSFYHDLYQAPNQFSSFHLFSWSWP